MLRWQLDRSFARLGRSHIAELLIEEFITKLLSERSEVREVAARALGMLGRGQSKVVTTLLEVLRSESSREVVEEILSSISLISDNDSQVVDELVRVWQSQTNAGLIHCPVHGLAPLTSSDSQALKMTIGLLHHNDPSVRSCAASRLHWVELGNKEVMEALINLIVREVDDDVCEEATETLMLVGWGSRWLVSQLQRLVSRRNRKEVRSVALWLLRELAGGNQDVIRTLLKLMHNSHERDECRALAIVLGSIAVGNQTAIDGLLKMAWQHPLREGRWFAVDALGNIGIGNESLIAAMLELMDAGDEDVQGLSIVTLGKIGGNNKKVRDVLLKHRHNEALGWEAAEVIEELGLLNRTLLAEAITMLTKGERSERYRGAKKLGAMGARTEEVKIHLLRATRGDGRDHLLRYNAVEAVSRLWPDSNDLLDALLERLHDEESTVRRYAVTLLGDTTIRRNEVQEAVLRCFNDTELVVRFAAFDTAVRLKLKSSSFVDHLLHMLLHDEDDRLRAEAARWLGKLAHDRKDVEETLYKLTQSEPVKLFLSFEQPFDYAYKALHDLSEAQLRVESNVPTCDSLKAQLEF